ncbi:MAG: hypothetical protein KBD17_01030 [Candidatus Pacebacteria bacterium]|nr:hypothetical protein [Candidatus Paceibacterota bacterium]
MNDFDKNALKNFILEASKATYASGDESIKEKQPDGSTTIEYKSGAYKYHDNYFGGEPYGGREVVFLDNKPIWIMVYYGLVYNGINKEVYGFLMESLSKTTIDTPYRGPTMYEKNEWKYENKLTGDVDNFSGTEKIFKNEKCIYEASYIGGLIDQ